MKKSSKLVFGEENIAKQLNVKVGVTIGGDGKVGVDIAVDQKEKMPKEKARAQERSASMDRSPIPGTSLDSQA